MPLENIKTIKPVSYSHRYCVTCNFTQTDDENMKDFHNRILLTHNEIQARFDKFIEELKYRYPENTYTIL